MSGRNLPSYLLGPDIQLQTHTGPEMRPVNENNVASPNWTLFLSLGVNKVGIKKLEWDFHCNNKVVISPLNIKKD